MSWRRCQDRVQQLRKLRWFWLCRHGGLRQSRRTRSKSGKEEASERQRSSLLCKLGNDRFAQTHHRRRVRQSADRRQRPAEASERRTLNTNEHDDAPAERVDFFALGCSSEFCCQSAHRHSRRTVDRSEFLANVKRRLVARVLFALLQALQAVRALPLPPPRSAPSSANDQLREAMAAAGLRPFGTTLSTPRRSVARTSCASVK